MEKHKCRVCWKNCSDDQALSIHIRSHMNFSSRDHQQEKLNGSDDIESASSSEEGEDKRLYYESKKTDPEMSLAMMDAGSVVLQDRESETESSRNQIRRRSKRIQKHESTKSFTFLKSSKSKSKFRSAGDHHHHHEDPEPLSSVSDVTAEEDVAFSLMMLSRDKWIVRRDEEFENQEQDESTMMLTDDESESKAVKIKPRASRAKYRCETCKKVFKSYQALGGHRASHKKMKSYGKPSAAAAATELEIENISISSSVAATREPSDHHHPKVHECPVCFRVFSSGQALGGHKRSHVTGAGAIAVAAPARNLTRSSSGNVEKLIDLNLPAPAEDEEMSQIELSAVSDAEFARL